MAAITQGSMLTMLRRRMRDQNQTVWNSPVDLREELNQAAANVLRFIQDNQLTQLDETSEDITTASGTLIYPLTTTNMRKVWRMQRLEGASLTDDAVQIPDNIDDWRRNFLQDTRNRYHYFVTRKSSTDVYSIGFAKDPSAILTFRVFLLLSLAALATDGTDDSSNYTQIPPDFHELVVQTAAVTLIDPGSTLFTGAVERLRELRRDVITDIGGGANPVEVISGGPQKSPIPQAPIIMPIVVPSPSPRDIR